MPDTPEPNLPLFVTGPAPDFSVTAADVAVAELVPPTADHGTPQTLAEAWQHLDDVLSRVARGNTSLEHMRAAAIGLVWAVRAECAEAVLGAKPVVREGAEIARDGCPVDVCDGMATLKAAAARIDALPLEPPA